MKLLEILLGQIPEAIYFALFMIYTKRLDKKRWLFIILMVTEYVLLFNFTPVSIWSHILYFVITYVILKLLYKERFQITDIFTLGIASIPLMIISAICYFVCGLFIHDIVLGNIIQKINLFVFLYIVKSKLPKIQNMYKLLWNRNDDVPKPMKSVTFRCINILLFNIMFVIINSYIIFYIIYY